MHIRLLYTGISRLSVVLLIAMALSGCASMQETQVVDDTLMNIIGDEGRIREYQHYVSQSIELRRINSGKIIETIVINPQSKGIVTGVTETEKGEKLMKISFGSNDETLSFFKSDNEGKYYLLYNNGETIKYGANEYKISYYYVGGERPYLYIKMDKRVYNAKGRPVRGKQE